jgi:hypothetical protein
MALPELLRRRPHALPLRMPSGAPPGTPPKRDFPAVNLAPNSLIAIRYCRLSKFADRTDSLSGAPEDTLSVSAVGENGNPVAECAARKSRPETNRPS